MLNDPGCGWWARYVHGHRRRRDLKHLMPALQDQTARFQLAGGDAFTLIDAFTVAVHQPGMEHWHCACGRTNRWVAESQVRDWDRCQRFSRIAAQEEL